MIKEGYRVEYDNEDQVCIIPMPCIPFYDFHKIVNAYVELGYKWWLPADERGGYILSKKKI